MKYPKRSQYKHAKSQYRVGNWSEYEAGLQRRGDITVWLSDDALDAWRAPASGKPGGQRTYADIAIEAALTIRMVFHLPLRRTHDSTRVPALLEQIGNPVASVSADGAYDTMVVYEAARRRGEGRAVRVLIPPGRDAQLSPRPSAAQNQRNRNIRSIRELGRREWHRRSGYSTRSLVENTVFRYKTIIGRCMRSRTVDGQRVEVQLASNVLNTMTRLGMPDSYRVA